MSGRPPAKGTAGAGSQLRADPGRRPRATQPYFGDSESSTGNPRARQGPLEARDRDGEAVDSLAGLFFSDPLVSAGPRPFDPNLPGRLFATAAGAPRGRAAARSRPIAEPGIEFPGPGAIVDKYRIEEVLGVGGFAIVYRATHLLLRTQVAIKMLRAPSARGAHSSAAALCEEARFAAKVDHPNVVRVLDVTDGPQITYFVMEYVEGTTLAKIIRTKGYLPAHTILRIGGDVAAGLEAGLARGLIHRDIKPANLIVNRAGFTKIVDLGLARSIGPGSSPGDAGAARSTVVGTRGYMAPEWATDPAAADFRADIYSLGVSLYHAAVGSLPFPSDDPAECMRMHVQDPVPPPGRGRPDFPEALSKLLLWLLAKNPQHRPQSYEALLDELRLAHEASLLEDRNLT